MLLTLIFMTFIAVDGKGSGSIPVECTELLDELGDALRVFDQCALDNSRPFEVCRRCASIYESAHRQFSDVIRLRNPRSKKCRTLVEDGKISLVKINFQHIEDIWNTDGVCSDCFDANSFNISKQVIEFFKLRDDFTDCIDRTWDFNTTCDDCLSEFKNLTNHFDFVLRAETRKGHCLCLDVLDAMNQTRATWGDRCYLPRRNMGLPVILATTASFVATAAFYLISKLAQSPKDTELARVNTLQSVMFEEGCECGAPDEEPCGCHQKSCNVLEGDIVQ